MAVSANNVFVGLPDQLTTGAILTGPVSGAAAPADIDDLVFTGLTDSGYVSEEGVTITPSDTTESIRDWSGAEIRRILTEFTGEIGWTHLELSAGALQNYFGEDNVDITAATVSSGTQIRAALGKHAMPEKSWYFKIKDGDRRLVVYVPRGQITTRGEIPLTSTGAVVLPVTLSTYPDADGNNIYLYTDDGIFSA